jgi:hypothetical protein
LESRCRRLKFRPVPIQLIYNPLPYANSSWSISRSHQMGSVFGRKDRGVLTKKTKKGAVQSVPGTTRLRLTHVGEPLVAAMLQRLADEERLSEIVCRRIGPPSGDERLGSGLERIGLKAPFEFLAEEAKLHIATSTGRYVCDGAQKVDVLCVGLNAVAAAFELKLGINGLGASVFAKRFCKGCDVVHGRVKWPMVSVLERRVNGVAPDFVLRASGRDRLWKVAKNWWLVMRTAVWAQYEIRGKPPLEHASVILIEELVELFGGQGCFNALALSLLGNDPFSAWHLGESPSLQIARR